MFHRFEPRDHGLDPAAYLLVLLEQRGPFGREAVLPHAQGFIFFLKLLADDDELKDIVGLRIKSMRERLDDALGPAKQLTL